MAFFWKPGTQEIRLALLQPGIWDDEISYHLTNSSLESPIAYESLSYVWAQETGHNSIKLNGKEHRITNNLFKALKRLRKAREARCLWIDAICIDQDSILEKNHQVALMGAIYRPRVV
ncbi:HET-domain-containing protein [Mollisia scopiformis]|uniref:HET-domain-containing protein n=1 Tax=Mollisia scopiformis TaxID=149040 RepID=A0A194X396_MOLSC|nr:HET-domain-containing protein [Mollisia scopiformis]KUJ14675.1 HET-domain-containing protein [Mollisia scopiformis]